MSEYTCNILREEQKKKAGGKLESLLLKGLESGQPTRMTKEYLDEIRQEARARLKTKK